MPGSLQAVPGTNTIYATMQATIPRWMAENSILWNVQFAWLSRVPQATPERGWSFLGGRCTSQQAEAQSCQCLGAVR